MTTTHAEQSHRRVLHTKSGAVAARAAQGLCHTYDAGTAECLWPRQ